MGVSSCAAASPTPQELEAIAREAYIFAFPLYELIRTRNGALQRQPANFLGHRKTLIRASSRDVTTPNNDTLYSSAWLDLAAGPVHIAVPDTAGRYYSIAFMDAYTNNFAYIGRRTTGTRAGQFIVVGPDEVGLPAGADAARVIRAPTRTVWALARWLVDGAEDVAAVNRLQDATRLEASGGAAMVAVPLLPLAPDPAVFFAAVNASMTENPPPPRDQAALERFARIGVGPGQAFAIERFDAAGREALVRGVDAARRDIRSAAGIGGDASGWSSQQGPIGNFGDDFLLRARVALGGLAALEPAEAHYAGTQTDDEGRRLDGEHRYLLRFEKDRDPPVDAFWSLTLYQITAEGRLYFVPNAIERYAVGDRSKGLQRGADGSLEIYLSATPPGGERDANWLPAPAGPFRLVMRAYQPRSEILDGRYRYPPVVRLN